MTDDYEDEQIGTVNLPILYGCSVYLYASGRVEISTSEDAADLNDHHIAVLANLLDHAQALRSGAIAPPAPQENP